jgi:hypothetical protein
LVTIRVHFPSPPLDNFSNRIKLPEINGFQGGFYWEIAQIDSKNGKYEGPNSGSAKVMRCAWP